MNIKNEVLYRVYIVLGLVMLGAVLIFFKAFKISYLEGERWRKMGKDLYVQYQPVEAERGNILAEDGSLLVTSLPFFEIRMDPNSSGMKEEDFFENLDTLAYCLATYVDNSHTIGGYRDLLLRKRSEGERNLLLKKDVTYDELAKIKNFPLFNKGRYKGGLIVKQQSKRSRPYKMLARRTIGYVRDGAKPVGLEGYFDDVLGGKAGKQLMQRVGKDIWIPVNDLTEIEPQNGNDIVTTIDINLQDISQQALRRALQHHDAEHGTAIVMEVKTGAIRAIANIGKTQDGWWETYNYAVGSAIEPGSTFKLASILALLEDGFVALEDSISINRGKMTFYDEEMVDATSQSFSIDSTTVREAFEISSNVGIAKLIDRHYNKNNNAARFIEQLKNMNLHLPTDIEIEGEANPYIKEAYSEDDDWSGITLPWMAIGYEVAITPLQLLTFYNAIANDGKMMKPYLVSDVLRFGEMVQHFKPTVVKKQIASKQSVQAVKELLEGVVERGTAKRLQSNRFRFAGKTGTAQFDYLKKNKRQRYRASFAGYFPAGNPLYSCMVMISEPRQNGFYGADVAGPVFREIADRCFETKVNMHQPVNNFPKPVYTARTLPLRDAGQSKEMRFLLDYLELPVAETTGAEWSVLEEDDGKLAMGSRTAIENLIPNVLGMGLRDALFVLENRGLKVKFSGSGKVVKQSIKPGKRIRGQTIKLTLK